MWSYPEVIDFAAAERRIERSTPWAAGKRIDNVSTVFALLVPVTGGSLANEGAPEGNAVFDAPPGLERRDKRSGNGCPSSRGKHRWCSTTP
jgi:hypothetical protein